MSSSVFPPQWEYDVFVSFRGKDVRDAFLGYLNLWLNLEGFRYFCDEEREHSGKKIKDIIFPSIGLSRVALIVLSENYADSRWCLNELVEILRCNKEHKNPEVIPVFYGVHPADVQNLTSKSKFGKAFKRLLQRGVSEQQRQEWTEALRGVKEFLGLEKGLFRKEPALLDEIVRTLRGKIGPRSLCFEEKAIGAERLAEDVTPLLKISQEHVRMRVIGISGPEGIGKTMVARAACKGTLGEPHRLIFLDKVGETNDNDFVKLQKKLLQNLNIQMPHDDNSPGYTATIRQYLNCKKILLVLDGVTKEEQMKKLGVQERDLFCHGSRILITTRDRNLLKDLEVDDEYIVEGLNRDEAFRLFCLHAFGGEEPEEGFEELSRYLAHYAGGHPLALREWGSFLKNQKNDWQKFSDDLVKNPENFNSFVPDLQQIFLEYPYRVVGPRGANRRTQTWRDEVYTGVRKIDVGFDSGGIKFIAVQYDKNGHSSRTFVLGTEGGKTSMRSVDFNYSEEYLTFISGHTKEDSGRTILQSLTFHTNTRKRQSIGTDEEGRKFSFPYTGHKIVGFRWSCNGSYLESIEAIYKRVPHTPIGNFGRVFGPFGGAGEKTWATDDITGIFVRYEDFINDINFKVRTKSSKPQTTYGDKGEGTFEVKLETPYEYITSFSGYFENARDGRILIKSLTFQTNKRILGPIGREEGKHFSSPSPSPAVKLTGFFVRITDYLESIGAQVGTYYPLKSAWLFGCSNAPKWDDGDDYTNVRKIIVEPDDEKFIRSITFHYEVKNGQSQLKRHPGIPPKYAEPPMIIIDANEYLTSMSGYYTERGITSLTFGTNKRSVELIDRKEGIHFSSPATSGKIIGFYGRSDENLKAIGAYFEQLPHPYPITLIGPFGGSSGETWKEENIEGRGKIEVEHYSNIHSIKFVYKDDSGPSYPIRGGRAEGLNVTKVRLDHPLEYLTSISGYAENGAIQSLTFYSNKGRYDPCGDERGKYFWYPSNGSRITGFYGTRDPNKRKLKSIGVYVEPIPRMYPFKTDGPFGGSVRARWDDGVHTDVRGFRISFDKAIQAIGIAYDNNGSFVSGPEHGIGRFDNGSFVFGLKPGKEIRDGYMEVLLDYPEERLRSIRVWVDKEGKTGQTIIQDLKIFTTRTYHGPFISVPRKKRNNMKQFHIPSKEDDGRIVGFFGRVGRYLHSIGARLEPY